MIADALRVDIETFAGSRFRQTLLFRKTEEGTLGVECIRAYLRDIHYLVANTPVCLKRAERRAEERGDVQLAAHYRAKSMEEVGHDAWAARDYASLDDTGVGLGALGEDGVSDEMKSLLRFVVSTIDRDPLLYLAYILFAEHLTVVVAPEWLAMLEERCGIPISSMTAIANHAELDKEHVEHALDEIDDLAGDPRMLYPMRATLTEAMLHYERFVNAIAGTHPTVDERHVSAA